MPLIESVKICFHKYAVFKGRASRSEYWWFSLFYTVGTIVLSLVSASGAMGSLIYSAFALGALLPMISVSVRRLHDIDRSGWYFLAFLIPLVGTILWLVWFCQCGTQGENRFGPDPMPINEPLAVDA
jgi:uncharacterized membrane protein YhaH (DUF805 family)